MMSTVEKKGHDVSYSAVYDCGNSITKVVSVYLDQREKAFLEIQRTGLELKIERLDFEHGMATTHNVTGRHGGGMQSLEGHPEEIDRILTEYANEFVDIVLENEKIRGYLKSHFTQLQKYIAKSVAFSRISTEKNIQKVPPQLPGKPE